jgi:ABC-type glycerol-3-phosphate transport system substrate-binding protein
MKKTAVITALSICASLLTGCTSSSPAAASVSTVQDGLNLTAADDILTYDAIDDSKTTLKVAYVATLSSTYTQMLARFTEKYPDIQIVTLDITGGSNKYHPYIDWLKNGDLPDIVLCSGLSGWTNNTEYFEDLTSYECANEYDSQTLLKYAADGQIYFLPGPANLSGMIYNKALFAQYGWKVPSTIDELIALCKQITADTNGTISPLNLDAKYQNVLIGTLEAMTYSQTMAGSDNYGWYQDYQNGKATFTGHMEPLFNLAQQFIDAGVLNKDSFTYSATTRSKEFENGSIAMINYDFSFVTDTAKYGTFAMPGKTADDAYIFVDNSFFTGIPKQDHSEKVKTAITEFLNFVSSEEGQKSYIGTQTMITSTKNKWMQESEISRSIDSIIQKGTDLSAGLL